MKTKILFFLVVLAAGGAALRVSRAKVSSDSKAHVAVGAPSRAESSKPAEVSREKESRPALPPVALSEAERENLMKAVQTPHEFERHYMNYKRHELERILQLSKTFVANRQLIEKANAGQLTNSEVQQLTLEIRRQNVLTRLLVQDDLEKIRGKYL